MKKIIFFFFTLLTALAGCSFEEPIPDPVILAPTLQASVSPDSIDYRGSSTITWSSENSEYVLFNGVKVEIEGSLLVQELIFSTNYKIVAVGNDGTTLEKNLTIVVGKAQAPTLKVTVSTDTIPYGGKSTFSWIVSGLVTSVTLDGKQVTNSGSFTTPSLYESKDYELVVTGPGGVVTEKVTISVGDWTTSNVGLMTHKPWLLGSMRYLRNGVVISNSILTEEMKTDLYYFSLDGTALVYHSNGIIFGGCNWHFVDSNYIFEGDITYSFKLSKYEYVRSKESLNSDGQPVTYEVILYRVKDGQ